MTHQDYLNLELQSASKHSLGIVQNEEVLARVLFSPKHYENGEIVASAFEQIFDPGGFSVLRQDGCFEKSLVRTIQLLQKDDENKYFGYVCAQVFEIRSVVYNTYRIFYVLDTAKKNRKSHADVFPIRLHEEMETQKKWLTNYIRYEIANVFNKVVQDAG